MADDELPDPVEPSRSKPLQDDALSPAAPPTDDKKAERRHTLVVAIIAGVVGIVGALSGSAVQIYGAARNQEAQFAEQRAKEDRDRRADVYLKFLDAANKYSVATVRTRDCILKARDSRPPGSTSYSLDGTCGKNVSDLAPSRQEFQGARNRVFVYGSEEAERQARVIASYLPNAVGGDSVTGLPPFDDDLFNFSDDQFNEMYRAFNAIVCREVPAQPRATC